MRRSFRLFSEVLVLLALFAAGAVATCAQAKPPTEKEKADANRAWESLVRAKGGREKLHAISSMVADYMDMTTLYVFPRNEWWFAHDLLGGPLLRVYDDARKIAYHCGAAGLRSSYPGSRGEAYGARPLMFLLETKWQKPDVLRVTRASEGKRRMEVIETSIGGQRTDFVYEPEEMLVTEVRWMNAKGEVNIKWALSSYSEIDGIKMPRKISIGEKSNGFANIKRVRDFNAMFNVDYDPHLFDTPCKVVAADGWKHGA